jgi:hypothetical protein
MIGVRAIRGAVRRRRRVSASDWACFRSALRKGERLSAGRAVFDGLLVVATLKRRGLRPLLRNLPELPAREPARARRVADAVDAGLGVIPFAATCLRRSVTLLRELHRLGIGATLHIGVRTGIDGVEAHAWVQVNQEIINDDPRITGTYQPLSVGHAERLMQSFV